VFLTRCPSKSKKITEPLEGGVEVVLPVPDFTGLPRASTSLLTGDLFDRLKLVMPKSQLCFSSESREEAGLSTAFVQAVRHINARMIKFFIWIGFGFLRTDYNINPDSYQKLC
jgi:hypothetical protein